MKLRYLILVGVVLGAVAGYYALWRHLAGQVEARAEAWFAEMRAAGREASHGAVHFGGFPYRLAIGFEQVAIGETQGPAPWRLQADRIDAYLQLWNFQHVIFDLPGAQRLAWQDGPSGARREALLRADRLRASLVLDGAGRWLRVAVDLERPALEDAAAGWSADRLLVHLRRAEAVPPVFDIALQAANAGLPAALDTALGRQLQEIKLTGKLSGPLTGQQPRDILELWRDAGGIVTIDAAQLQWNGLRFEGDGTFTLDRQLRPLAAFSGKLRGADHLIDALQGAGRMKPGEALAAKAALKLVERREGDQPPYLPVPLTAQDGRLSLGPVPLLSLSPVWPALPPKP